MKLSNIEINNFRQYYNAVNIDLSTNSDQNIVVIGGRNGYGKTNLLLSIVWCFYGEKISQIDDNFKKEIQKEKNYSSFMQQSINWTAKKENKDTFSVSIIVSEIELPELNKLNTSSDKPATVTSFIPLAGLLLSILRKDAPLSVTACSKENKTISKYRPLSM